MRFTPAQGGSNAVNNSGTATAAVELPKDCDGLYLANTSATATAYFRVTTYAGPTAGAGEAPTVALDMAVLPSREIFVGVAKGVTKVIRTIASAADGKLQITPGNFN